MRAIHTRCSVALINRAGQEISAKVVYYGPGLSGKTTNLEVLFRQVPEDSRGKMISMKTRTDRTLFFDLLPIAAEAIHDFQVRILLYTVPGQVYYNATRRLVLKGVDAVVFVADSQRGKMEENLESLENLRSNLADMDLKLEEVPWVIQYNKRDLPDILSVEELDQALNPSGVPSFAAVAPRGEGVQETLEGVSSYLRPYLQDMVEKEMGDSLGITTPKPEPVEDRPEVLSPSLDETRQPLTSTPNMTSPGVPPTSANVETLPDVPERPIRSGGLDLDRIPDPPVVEMPPSDSDSPPPTLGNLMQDQEVRRGARDLEETIDASPLGSFSDKTPAPESESPSVEKQGAVDVEVLTTRPRPTDTRTVAEPTVVEWSAPETKATPPPTPEPPAPTPETKADVEEIEISSPPRIERGTPQPFLGMPEPRVVEAPEIPRPQETPADPPPAPPVIETSVSVEPDPAPVSAPSASIEEQGPQVLELKVPRRFLESGELTVRLVLEDEGSPASSSTPGKVALRDGELVELD